MLSKSRLRWERLVTLSERSASAISVERKEWSFAVPKGPKGEKRPADVIGAAVKLIDAAAPKPSRRGSYKKRNSN